jgi:hypothetical protein
VTVCAYPDGSKAEVVETALKGFRGFLNARHALGRRTSQKRTFDQVATRDHICPPVHALADERKGDEALAHRGLSS